MQQDKVLAQQAVQLAPRLTYKPEVCSWYFIILFYSNFFSLKVIFLKIAYKYTC